MNRLGLTNYHDGDCDTIVSVSLYVAEVKLAKTQ